MYLWKQSQMAWTQQAAVHAAHATNMSYMTNIMVLLVQYSAVPLASFPGLPTFSPQSENVGKPGNEATVPLRSS